MRLGFRWAAFVTDLSSLCAAILVPGRHFSFRCVSIQQVILRVRMFSSASIVFAPFDVIDPLFFFFILCLACVVVGIAFK